MDSAPSSHKFKLTMFQPTDPQNFFRTVRKEIKLLRSSLPPGIWVKGFEDRMVSGLVWFGLVFFFVLFCEWHAGNTCNNNSCTRVAQE